MAETPAAAATTPTASSRSVNQTSQQLQPPINLDKYDVNDGLPTEESINEKTLEDEPQNPGDAGEFTDQLSDVSDAEEDQTKATASRNAVSTWYRRIQPLIRNKRVRVFAIINTILTILNVILFVGCLVILGFLIYEAVEVNTRTQQDKPCIFQWTEWSACPATCASSTSIPMRERHVNKTSIIPARGDKYKECPKDLESRKDYAPCNTHLCPRKLSSFDTWTSCFQKDAADMDKGCYKMRDLEIGDYLIEIDTDELQQDCDCPPS